jgi:hypothetical protein
MVTARVRSETVEVYHGTAHLLTLPRLMGESKHRIDYRHVIWSLVRKPGAFAHYRYRDELFPTVTFREAYDALRRGVPTRADREYVRVLHLAASISESDVEAALKFLAEQRQTPVFDAVRELVRDPGPAVVPQLSTPELNLEAYDRLLAGGARYA